jgi:serine O-acetyltransferase
MNDFPGYLQRNHYPSRQEVIRFTESLIEYLFPEAEHAAALQELQAKQLSVLGKQLVEILTPLSHHQPIAVLDVVNNYLAQLPQIKSYLLCDARLILSFDPAAFSMEEVILSYPGFLAIKVYRLAHPLYEAGIPLLPRMMSEWAHSQTGIDIHPGATIGTPFFIDHGTGVVIGETTVIGENVKIYQGVTLGALAVKKEQARKKRHPTIQDNVTIYANSTILGGDTVVGHDSVIGGNTWLTTSVLPHSIVYTKSETIVSDKKEFTEPMNFVI